MGWRTETRRDTHIWGDSEGERQRRPQAGSDGDSKEGRRVETRELGNTPRPHPGRGAGDSGGKAGGAAGDWGTETGAAGGAPQRGKARARKGARLVKINIYKLRVSKFFLHCHSKLFICISPSLLPA